MSRPDKVRVEFRGIMDANLTGVFGDTDLVCVKQSSGKLVAADQGEAEGIVWTREGKQDSSLANLNVALADQAYTVFQAATFVDTGLAAGDVIWSTAGGDIVTSNPGTATIQKLGTVYTDDNADLALVVNISLAD